MYNFNNILYIRIINIFLKLILNIMILIVVIESKSEINWMKIE